VAPLTLKLLKIMIIFANMGPPKSSPLGLSGLLWMMLLAGDVLQRTPLTPQSMLRAWGSPEKIQLLSGVKQTLSRAEDSSKLRPKQLC